MSTLLDVKNLGISFGGLRAVNDFDLKIQKEELYGLIGPNGAGKTTVFNLLTGVYKPDSGKVLLDGKDLTGKKNIEISKAGIARTFQNIRLFKELTVLDNVKVGLHNHHHYSTIEGILRLPNYRKVEKEMNEKAMEIGCKDTHFVTPNGLDGTDAGGEHHTTAADLALIMRYCVALSPKKEEFLQVTQTQSYSFWDCENQVYYNLSLIHI